MSGVLLPEEGTLYWDYLVNFPIGIEMDMHLHIGADDFLVKKTGGDSWSVNLCKDELSTLCLFELVCDAMDGADSVIVSHGQDPRRVKQEFIDRCVQQQELINEAGSDDDACARHGRRWFL